MIPSFLAILSTRAPNQLMFRVCVNQLDPFKRGFEITSIDTVFDGPPRKKRKRASAADRVRS
jgi:hypothetical protein